MRCQLINNHYDTRCHRSICEKLQNLMASIDYIAEMPFYLYTSNPDPQQGGGKVLVGDFYLHLAIWGVLIADFDSGEVTKIEKAYAME